MIKKFLTLLLFYFCTLVLPVEAAITRGVGPVSGSVGGAPSESVILTGTTIGSMIVIVIGNANFYASVTTVTISGEADPTLISGFSMTANGDSYGIYYLLNNTAGGDKTITVNFTANAYSSMIAIEYFGQDTTTQPDATATTLNGSTGDPTISITTATAGDLIITACSSDAAKPTVPSGYTTLSLANPGYYGAAADNIAAGVAGSKTLIWADVTNSNWGVTAVAFRSAVVGVGTVRHRVVQ